MIPHDCFRMVLLLITCLIAFGQFGDELVSVGLDGSLHHIRQGDVAQAVRDVLLHGASKQHGLLADQGHLERNSRCLKKPQLEMVSR